MRFVVVLHWCDGCGVDISGHANTQFCDACRRDRHRVANRRIAQTPARRAYKAAWEREKRARAKVAA